MLARIVSMRRQSRSMTREANPHCHIPGVSLESSTQAISIALAPAIATLIGPLAVALREAIDDDRSRSDRGRLAGDALGDRGDRGWAEGLRPG